MGSEKKMTKTEAKKIAFHAVMVSIGTTYYRFCDNDDYSDREKALIIDYIEKYGERAAKALGAEYVAY